LRGGGGEGTLAVRASTKTTEALTSSKDGELMSILLTKRQPQPDAPLDGAVALVLIPELPPLTTGFLVVVDEGLELSTKIIGVICLAWRCAGGGRC
jgi:hypothetical protein